MQGGAWLIGAGLLWAGFAYLGYPLALTVLARRAARGSGNAERGAARGAGNAERGAARGAANGGDAEGPSAAAEPAALPALSVIVTVHDEQRALPGKLDDTLALDYPRPFEVIVASDGSTDGTEAVARSYASRGVRLVALAERGGKEAAQAAAIAQAQGEVLVFTDVAARLEKDALMALARRFADPAIGCVSSVDVVDATEGEGAYVRYEMAIRALESRIGCVVGMSGSCFAVRRALCDPWPSDLASDFRCALECLRRGLRTASAADARARFGTARGPADEWRRRVRTARRGIAVLLHYASLLDPRCGRVAFVLLGHKLARFTAWIGLGVAFAASLWTAPTSPVAAGIAGAGALALALAGLALVAPRARRLRAARFSLHFVLLNAAMARAWLHHLRGDRAIAWSPTRR